MQDRFSLHNDYHFAISAWFNSFKVQVLLPLQPTESSVSSGWGFERKKREKNLNPHRDSSSHLYFFLFPLWNTKYLRWHASTWDNAILKAEKMFNVKEMSIKERRYYVRRETRTVEKWSRSSIELSRERGALFVTFSAPDDFAELIVSLLFSYSTRRSGCLHIELQLVFN